MSQANLARKILKSKIPIGSDLAPTHAKSAKFRVVYKLMIQLCEHTCRRVSFVYACISSLHSEPLLTWSFALYTRSVEVLDARL